MVRSMTGYGRQEMISGQRRVVLEIKAVNHRFLDLNIRMPRRFICLEDRIRSVIQKKITRGHLDIFITVDCVGGATKNIKVDKELAKAYYKEILDLQAALDLDGSVSLQNLLDLPDILKAEEPEEDTDCFWQELLEPALQAALTALNAMREVEGQKLLADINNNLDHIACGRDKIAERAPQVVADYRLRLENKLAEILAGEVVDENRLLTEAALFADKADINEELVRLHSHLQQFAAILQSEEAVGRKLDFLNQEIYREINTIGSKANDLEIIGLVVSLKGEVEKIKEQIQNIE